MQTFSSKACEFFKFIQWAENVYSAANSQRNEITYLSLLASLIPVNTQEYALVRGWNCSLIVRLRTKMNPRWPQGCLFTFLLLDLDIPCLMKHQKGLSEANVILYSPLILLNLFRDLFCLPRNVLRSPFSER